MFSTIRKVVAGAAALGALALGGAAIANAASDDSTPTALGSGAQTQLAAGYGNVPQGGGPGGGHVGANGGQEELLTGATAEKVEKAALAKVQGGTIVRVETDVDHGSAYEAHVRKSDGTEVEVLVNKDFEVTAVNEIQR
jgi:uncharacterized membrane protein YkoI